MNDVAAMRENQSEYGGLRGLLDSLARLHARNADAILGIVTHTDGSTYQKPGALVLLDEAGLLHGAISGGCLEPALEDAARHVRVSGRAAAIEFDTRSDEDLLFGSGIGCRGRVRLLLLLLPPGAPLAQTLLALAQRGGALQIAIAADGAELGAGVATFATKSTMQHPSATRWDSTGRASAISPPPTLSIQVPAPPRLLLLGAGPETPPLATFARRLGWFVDVAEHRGRWQEFVRAAAIDRLIDLAPAAAIAALADARFDAAIVMSHNYAVDLEYLRWCARGDISYVGLLGPIARRDALLAELDADAAQHLRGRLHAPVGLDLGGHGGEAIALAISAQLQKHFATRDGSHVSSIAAARTHALDHA